MDSIDGFFRSEDGKDSYYYECLPRRINVYSAMSEALEISDAVCDLATLPILLKIRADALSDAYISNVALTSSSEEAIGKTKMGNSVAIIMHGTGILSPNRIKDACDAGLTDIYGISVSNKEFRSLLEGRIEGKPDFPVLTYDDFLRTSYLPKAYGVILDDFRRETHSKIFSNIASAYCDRLVIARCGGKDIAKKYIRSVIDHSVSSPFYNFHNYDGVDFDSPQTRLLFVGSSSCTDINGSTSMDFYGRFVRIFQHQV